MMEFPKGAQLKNEARFGIKNRAEEAELCAAGIMWMMKQPGKWKR